MQWLSAKTQFEKVIEDCRLIQKKRKTGKVRKEEEKLKVKEFRLG